MIRRFQRGVKRNPLAGHVHRCMGRKSIIGLSVLDLASQETLTFVCCLHGINDFSMLRLNQLLDTHHGILQWLKTRTYRPSSLTRANNSGSR